MPSAISILTVYLSRTSDKQLPRSRLEIQGGGKSVGSAGSIMCLEMRVP
jgi:hypothetical protein